MFGKPYAEYLRFQAPVLVAVIVVGIARLVLSLAGLPDSVVRFVPMTAVALVGLLYYGLRVGRTGFGTYRHILPLVLNQTVLVNTIAIVGIAISAAGSPNIYDAPEMRGPFGANATPLSHALAHLTIGNIVPTFLGWGIASLIMRFAGRPARTGAEARG